jgi:lantibiotic modifying enzyme
MISLPRLDTQRVIAVLHADRPRQLRRIVSRTLVLELYVARLQGLLQGNTAVAATTPGPTRPP